MVGWHHRLNGHEFEQTLEDSEGPGNLEWEHIERSDLYKDEAKSGGGCSDDLGMVIGR